MRHPDDTEIATFLSGIPFFQEVTRDGLERLSRQLTIREFEGRHRILGKGEPGASMYAIFKGRVRIHDGDHQYGDLIAGECFGEYSLIDQKPRSASVTALEDSLLLEISDTVFLELMRDDPGFARGILAVMIRRHRQLDEVQEGLATSKAEIETAHAQINSLVEGAMDAIVLFDRNYRIRLTNPAANSVFENEDILGRNLLFFLEEEGAAQIESVVDRAQKGPLREFLPKPLVIIGSGEGRTLAEGTLGSFTDGDEPVFTLILRNIEDRVRDAETIDRLTKQADYLESQIRELTNDHGIIAEDASMKHVLHLIEQVAGTRATVLVTGETGTGKELVARAIHRASDRAEKPMIRVNCGAIPANLIESELFGHEKGAFTGATQVRKGRFLLADGGTIFLDEIGELPLELQPKLLRVIQEGEFDPLGSSETVRVDVRIIAATHRDLKRAVARGRFREDLYYRLNVFPIRIPPLRERGGDLLMIAEDMIRNMAARLGRPPVILSDADRALFMNYNWPGNVRELQNLIERGVIVSRGGKADWQAILNPAAARPEESGKPAPQRVLSQEELVDFERRNLLRALELAGGRISGKGGAAALLGIPPSTLASKMKALGISKTFSTHENS